MSDQQPASEEARAGAAYQVHPHPIRWDVDRQLWVCARGCGFTRPKRERELVPTREQAHKEARRAGTGVDFIDRAHPPSLQEVWRMQRPATSGQR